jgi:hypothetical protein
MTPSKSGCPRPPGQWDAQGQFHERYRGCGDWSMGDRSILGDGVAVRWSRRFGLHDLVIHRSSFDPTRWRNLDQFIGGVDRPNDDHLQPSGPIASARLSTGV